jgi:hypothetical protein
MSSYGSEPPYQPPDQPFGSPPTAAPPPPPPYAPAPATYGTPAYGAPAGYVTAVNPYDSRSTTILVFGILGLVLCPFLGAVAWVMGVKLKKEAEGAGYPEPGQSKAGRICGIIATVLMILYIVFVILFIAGISIAGR